MPIQVRSYARQDALNELDSIFKDLQARFHDEWDWMEASFAVDCLKAELEYYDRLFSEAKCGSCEGRGWHEYLWDEYYGPCEHIECEACRGTGRLL